jgi:hypothetical protein
MSSRPSNNGREQIAEIATFFCQLIGVTHRALLVWRSRDDPGFLQPFQSVGQNICGDLLW